jgi:hypothetical protein
MILFNDMYKLVPAIDALLKGDAQRVQRWQRGDAGTKGRKGKETRRRGESGRWDGNPLDKKQGEKGSHTAS